MYRAALSLTMNSAFGQLEALGPVGGILSNIGRFVLSISLKIKRMAKPNKYTKISSESEK